MRDELNALTPRLRRYARALVTGGSVSCEVADDLVHATLMRALGNRGLGARADLAIRLYATVTQLHRELAMAGKAAITASAGRPSLVSNGAPIPQAAARHGRLAAALLRLPLEEREALLLVALEGFDHGDAARILRVSRPVLYERLTLARTLLDQSLSARPSKPAARERAVPYLRLVT